MLKNRYKWCQHPSKNSSQINTPTWIDFGPNLAPFWDGFGSQDRAKLAPNRCKNRSSKRSTKMITSWIAPKSIFNRFWAPNGPKMGVTNVYILDTLGSWGSLGPKMGQNGPKTPPRRPPAPMLDDFEPHLGRFCHPIWMIVGFNLKDVGNRKMVFAKHT